MLSSALVSRCFLLANLGSILPFPCHHIYCIGQGNRSKDKFHAYISPNSNTVSKAWDNSDTHLESLGSAESWWRTADEKCHHYHIDIDKERVERGPHVWTDLGSVVSTLQHHNSCSIYAVWLTAVVKKTADTWPIYSSLTLFFCLSTAIHSYVLSIWSTTDSAGFTSLNLCRFQLLNNASHV